MVRQVSFSIALLFSFLIVQKVNIQENSPAFFNKPFSVEYEEEIAKQINAGIDEFLTEHTKVVTGNRETFWNRRFESV